MKALVTGSTGFIGSALCRELVAQGVAVRAFHRSSSSLLLLEGLDVEHTIGDLTQPDTLREALVGVDVVFHTAAQLGAPDNPGRMYAVTVEGTRAVLDAALDARVQRLVHTSSVAALGVPETRVGQVSPQEVAWINENHTWNYRPDYWMYGYTKYLAELEVQKAIARGLDAVIVNPTYVIGAGDIHRQSSSPIVQIALQKLRFATEGGFNVVHLADVVAGHLAALQKGRTGERYILGNENLTIAHTLHKIAQIVGVPSPNILLPGGLLRTIASPIERFQSLIDLPVSASTLHQAGYGFYYDTGKARIELGLTNLHSVDQAIQEAYDWFVQVGTLVKRA